MGIGKNHDKICDKIYFTLFVHKVSSSLPLPADAHHRHFLKIGICPHRQAFPEIFHSLQTS